jgi:hypothetical protein
MMGSFSCGWFLALVQIFSINLTKNFVELCYNLKLFPKKSFFLPSLLLVLDLIFCGVMALLTFYYSFL